MTSQYERDAIEAAIAKIEEDVITEGWDDPLPLGWSADLPAFPVDALPPVLARFVRGLALEVQTPADLPGSVVLGILAATVGGRVIVIVRRGWREPTNLFVVPVMPPGSRKSAVISVCRAPLTEAEVALAEKVGSLIADRRTEREIREQIADAAKRNAAKDGDPIKIMEAQEAVRAAEQVIVPAWPRLTASDATPEALITLLANQGGRIAAISAEAGIFTSLTGRYSKSPNLDPILMAHAGDAILVDRRGREPERVDAPALTLVASIQPYALRELVERPDFGGRGVLARILWALPVDNTGHRDVEPPEMPERDREAYRHLVYDLALSMAEREGPVAVTLTEAARKVHLEYHRTVEARLRRGGDLGADLVREWGSKLAGAVARIAGCLHAASAPLADPISESTMRAAVELGDYYQAHAVAALATGGEDANTAKARLLLAWVADKGITRLKLRDIQRTGPKTLRKASDVRPVLDSLAELGWLREHQLGGWEVHPRADRLLKAGDTGDTGDNPSVSAAHDLSHPVAPIVAPTGDTGDVPEVDGWPVATVAPAGDNTGDTLSHPLTSANTESVAPVAPVAPIPRAMAMPDVQDGEHTAFCPVCGFGWDTNGHYVNCEEPR
ncbi:YfjI family protein [Micromonospora sp. NPDC049662]|uniref:YfjI family protein n=1 Tax=Micromonospora sp. NPDC049662 TaxID=3155397 RepID=UPI0034247F6D